MTDHWQVEECQICQKHHGEGPLKGILVGRTPHFWVWHGPPRPDGKTRLGYVVIESDRHAPYIADLTQKEAAELGKLRVALAAAIREALQPEFVFSAVMGMGVGHFHEHVFARPHREPKDVPWDDSDSLLDGVEAAGLEPLAQRLRVAIQDIQ